MGNATSSITEPIKEISKKIQEYEKIFGFSNWGNVSETVINQIIGRSKELKFEDAKHCLNKIKNGFASLIKGVGVIVIFVNGMYRYYRNPKPDVVEEAQSQKPVRVQDLAHGQPQNDDQPNQQHNRRSKLKWKRIPMSQKLFNSIKQLLTEDTFLKQIASIRCQLTKKIMIEPSQMKCCQNLGKAQKEVLEKHVKKFKNCPFCLSQATEADVQLNTQKQNQVYGFRLKVHAHYLRLPNDLQDGWRDLIDFHFGEGYTKEYIEDQKDRK